MKKILSILAASLFIWSCSSNVDYYNEDVIRDNVVNNYNRSFVSTFGQPSPNQDWGFNSKVTRSANPNSNQWAEQGYNVPGAITQSEIDKVLAVFNQKGEEHYESLVDWEEFFVQQVWKGTASYTAGNGGTVVGGNQMDWLCAGSPSMGDDHVNNFNNAAGSIMLMVNSSTQRFGYKSSTDNGHVFYYFRMEEIDGAYYVGFDFSAEGQNPNEQVQRDYIYNDWIVKIVPGKGVSTPPSGDTDLTGYNFLCRVFAEDLSASQNTDFDFNDVVFDVYTNSSNQAKIRILAVGGTLPLKVAGYEIHEVIGVSPSTMVNSTDAVLPTTINDVRTTADVDSKIIVEVDKGVWVTLTAERGQPAAKFAVNEQIDWCAERQDITKKYSNFNSWVNNGTPEIWWR